MEKGAESSGKERARGPAGQRGGGRQLLPDLRRDLAAKVLSFSRY